MHHGQGTQYAHYNDPRVLTFSAHRYKNGVFWRSLRQGEYDFEGAPGARGSIINVPLNQVGELSG